MINFGFVKTFEPAAGMRESLSPRELQSRPGLLRLVVPRPRRKSRKRGKLFWDAFDTFSVQYCPPEEPIRAPLFAQFDRTSKQKLSVVYIADLRLKPTREFSKNLFHKSFLPRIEALLALLAPVFQYSSARLLLRSQHLQ